MKRILIFGFTASVALVLIGGVALAEDSQVVLPSPGLVPGDMFYFLDRLGENLRQFFTFNPEAKAKLQIEFTGERVAEIKIIVEKKGADEKALARAESLLRANIAYSAKILDKEKARGKDVATLAKTLDDKFDARNELLRQTFKSARAQLKAQRKEIRTNFLTEAHRTGDVVQIALLEARLNNINQQIDTLGEKKDRLESSLREELKSIEEEMDENEQAKEKLEREQEELENLKEDKEEMEAEETDEPDEADESVEAEGRQDADIENDDEDDSQNADRDN